MFLKVCLFLLVTSPVVLPGWCFADPAGKEHGHKSAHGGLVQEAEGIKVEFLFDKDGQPKLYLYDGAMKALDRADIATKLTIKGHDGAQYSRDLKAVKDPKEGIVYKGEPIKGLKDWGTAVVSLKIKDRWSHIRFSHH